MLNLYDACVSDLANALLQSSKRHAFIGGKYHGARPSAETLAKRAHQGISPTPAATSRVVEEIVSGTPMHEEPNYKGDNITVARKRNTNRPVIGEEVNATHRPEFVAINQPRRKGARHLDFEGVAQQSKMETSSAETSIEMVFESDVHDTTWAIRRIKGKSIVSC